MTKTLFDPVQYGDISLSNHIHMAPLTRARAGSSRVPNDLMVEYYAQRASAGLIITEATAISAQGFGWAGAPGIYTDEMEAGWKKVTDAVHAKGGKIVLQLWHMGRLSHPVFQEGGALPVAPSAIQPAGHTRDASGKKDYVVPRALDKSELPGIIADYMAAAQRSIRAGFDGVEIHGANGYLLDQFLRSSSNVRTDAYGGSVENRARLLLEVVAAVAKEIGADRTGVRLSPVSPASGAVITGEEQEQFNYVAEKLNGLGIVYIHVVEGETGGPRDAAPFDYAALRSRFKNTYIANNGYDLNLANQHLAAGEADLIAFGRPFIANPDLVERLKTGAELNQLDPTTLYGGGAKGYIDYPTLDG